MDGLSFLRSLPVDDPMPMARHFSFRILTVAQGNVSASAVPSVAHENPFQVVQGGFAATVLDIALGLVSISVLTGDAESVATTDLTVRYLRSIKGDAEHPMTIQATTIHVGRRIVVAEARLEDHLGKLCALAQSNSFISRAPNS